MTPEEKFIFDLQGYIVVKNVLSQAEVDELNAIADQKMADQEEMSNGLKIPRRVSLWDKPFQNLFDHPNMIPYLSELLGPQFRADHATAPCPGLLKTNAEPYSTNSPRATFPTRQHTTITTTTKT